MKVRRLCKLLEIIGGINGDADAYLAVSHEDLDSDYPPAMVQEVVLKFSECGEIVEVYLMPIKKDD